MIEQGYGFRRQARRPGMYLALGIGMIAIYLSITLKMDTLVIVLAGLYLALVLRRLVMNPARGFQLRQNAIEWVSGVRTYAVPLSDLDGVSIGQGAHGQTLCVLRLRNGESTSLPGVEKIDPKALMHQFGVRGIPIWG
ncbi:MAG: hypothetical protein WBC95_07520 [Albidovulum sp.]